ncbi:hypothetical protein SMICM17S_11537 [Streptomyces microflavus]
MDIGTQGAQAPADLAWLRGMDAYTMGAYPQGGGVQSCGTDRSRHGGAGALRLHALRIDTATALLRMYRHRDRFGEQRTRHRRPLNSWYWLGWWVGPVLESPRDLRPRRGHVVDQGWIDELGNGRFLRTLYEKSCAYRDLRLSGYAGTLTRDDLSTLRLPDLVPAYGEVLSGRGAGGAGGSRSRAGPEDAGHLRGRAGGTRTQGLYGAGQGRRLYRRPAGPVRLRTPGSCPPWPPGAGTSTVRRGTRHHPVGRVADLLPPASPGRPPHRQPGRGIPARDPSATWARVCSPRGASPSGRRRAGVRPVRRPSGARAAAGPAGRRPPGPGRP